MTQLPARVRKSAVYPSSVYVKDTCGMNHKTLSLLTQLDQTYSRLRSEPVRSHQIPIKSHQISSGHYRNSSENRDEESKVGSHTRNPINIQSTPTEEFSRNPTRRIPTRFLGEPIGFYHLLTGSHRISTRSDRIPSTSDSTDPYIFPTVGFSRISLFPIPS